MASPAKRQCCDVSRELNEAIAREDWTKVKNILPESSRHDADRVVTQLINEDRWSAVRRIIKCVGSEERTWDIEGVLVKNNILLSVADREWTCITESPNERFPDSTFQWVMKQACTPSTDLDLVLPHCADDRLDSVLTILVERRQWLAVGEVLVRGVSDHKKQWAVREACKHCKHEDFQTFDFRRSCQRVHVTVEQVLVRDILPHCADDQVHSVLITLVERRLWQAVGVVLEKKGVSDYDKQDAVQKACMHSKDCELDSLIQNILPHCAVDQVHSVLITLVERHLWQAVGVVLEKKGVSDNDKEDAIVKACLYCKDCEQVSLIQNILPHCAGDRLQMIVLKRLVERRLWQAVVVVLETEGAGYYIKQDAVEKACMYCKDCEQVSLIQNVLPHCDDQVHSVLTTLVERRLWQAVGVVLDKKGVSDSNKQWAVQEACKHCEDCELLVSLIQNKLPHCADDQVHMSVLTTLVERRLWQAVGVFLEKKGVSDSNKQWAVQKACMHCKDCELVSLIKNILPHCADDQVHSVLTIFLERCLWKPVCKLLQRHMSETQRRWALEEASKTAKDDDFTLYILPYCSDQYLDSVMPNLVKRRLWKPVAELLQQGVGKTQRRWAVEEGSKAAVSDSFFMYVLPNCSNQHLRIVPYLVENGLWDYVQQILHRTAKHFLCQLVKQEGHTIKDDSDVWAIPNNCHLNVAHAVKLFGVVKKETARKVHELHTCLGLKEDLCDLLYTSYIHQVCFELFREEETAIMTDSTHSLVPDIYLEIISCIQTISTNSVKEMVDYVKSDACKITTLVSQLRKLSSSSVPLCYPFLKQFSLYCTCRHGNADDDVFLMMFAVLPLIPELQSVALRIMLRHKRWDVISQADLSGVWEQDRRHLLEAAVKQRQWSVVKRWADHTLFDDQRVWALNKALNEKQWDVALLLADHGLTDIDLMRVHYRLAKYADLDVILQMFERGADVAEVKERLGRMKDNKRIAGGVICCIDDRYSKMKNFEKEIKMSKLVAMYADLTVILHMLERGADVVEVRERLGRMKDNKRIPKNVIRCIDDRCSKVRNLEKEIQMAKSDALENACRSCNWICVLFTLIRNPGKVSVYCALKVAIQKKAWHVVMQLVRLGIDAKQRHSLFSRMMKRRQWGVCRVLLEQGLSVQLCLKVLPQLMDMNQWALVARVMEHDVGNDVRQQVMQRAWERREGSVVWLCIKSLPTPLSVEKREALFQRAFSCELWQVIKPLVEKKDTTGIRHRDTALLEAIEQHQWDLVDHCQRYHADINMKDDDGHTPLQRAAIKKDWEAVEELVVRDGDPNLGVSMGYTVLHRAIEAEQWSTVKLLIEYHADIQKTNIARYKRERVTPLCMLIDTRQGNLIEHTLLWCPDQSEGVNDMGETTLHAACLSGRHDSMYYLVARKVNPLAVTKTKQSALVYAVLNEDCPQRMVSECIRLGFSTHQPRLTKTEIDQSRLIACYCVDRIIMRPEHIFTSPFLCAMLHGLPVVMKMLYESGACNQRELFRLFTELPKLADPNTVKGRKLQERAGHDVDAYQNFVTCIENIALPFLTEIATTPRSLVSTCRLVISHCLTLSKTRHRDVHQLPLTERMKNFVLFSDLTDPDFGKDTT